MFILPNNKKKEDYYLNPCLSQLKDKLRILKWFKENIFYEIIASIAFILTRRICLWCPIMKRTETIMWLHVYPNWKTNFNSNNGGKRSFSYEIKASISFIPIWRMCLLVPNHETKGDYYTNLCLSKSTAEH